MLLLSMLCFMVVHFGMPDDTPPTPQPQPAPLPESKPVTQIVGEWQAIEAKRPGGRMAMIEEALELGRTPKVRVGEGERMLLDILTSIYRNNQQYHAEMGILISALAAAEAERDALRAALGEYANPERYDADGVMWLEDEGDVDGETWRPDRGEVARAALGAQS